MLRQLQYPIPRPFRKQRLVDSVLTTNQLQFVLEKLGWFAESAAFLWTMAGCNDNTILEIGRHLIGSFDIFENHCQALEQEVVNQHLQSRLNAI